MTETGNTLPQNIDEKSARSLVVAELDQRELAPYAIEDCTLIKGYYTVDGDWVEPHWRVAVTVKYSQKFEPRGSLALEAAREWGTDDWFVVVRIYVEDGRIEWCPLKFT